MNRRRALLAGRAVLTGWGALGILALVERPVLSGGYAILGGLWASAAPVLDFVVFGASGWVVARTHREIFKLAVGTFISSLVFFDLAPFLPLNVPFVLKLFVEAVGDSRYWQGFFISLLSNGMLLVSVWMGATMGRAKEPPPKIT